MFRSQCLGENIRKHRKRLHLTQAQLAEQLYVSPQGISNWELGLVVPDLENLVKLAEYFHVTVDDLLHAECEVHTRTMIGVDGGGTKTEFVLFSDDGAILRRILLGSSNPNDIGLEASCELLAEGIDLLMEQSDSVSGVFVGVAGGTTGDNKQVLSQFLKKRYPKMFTDVDSDAINVLASGHVTSRGMAMICGTGSVLFVRQGGQVNRIGGWGYLLDGAGSGYDLGADAIRAALGEGDGLGPKTVLTGLVEEKLGGAAWQRLHDIYKGGKPYIATFSRTVFAAAEQGDAVAQEILERNCRHLADLVLAARRKYDCGNQVIACGGIFEHHRETMLSLLGSMLPPEITFILPTLPPVFGACVECCYRMGDEPAEGFTEQFTHDYEHLTKKG